MRLIDADAVKDVIAELNKNGYDISPSGLAFVRNILLRMPTIEPNHGKWKHDADGLVWCYGCGFGKERSDERPYNYCPNCGAKMGGDIKDSE